MGRYSKIHFNLLQLIFLIVIIAGCANNLPPPGGPPDKTPPKIIGIDPANGTLNFKSKSITLEFNKYMDKNKVNDNVFISPNVPFTLDWSGKELEIDFSEDLAPNTTYALTLGTEYTDIKQNKPTEAFSLIFSTGSVIDSGIVKGKLFDKDPSGVFIFCYKIDGINVDTLNITHTRPYSRIQVGTNGYFELHALKNGLYRFFAVRDKFKDGIYDSGMDDISAAPNDVIVRQDSASNLNLKIGPVLDKSAPILNVAEPISNKRILLEFNENIDTLSVNKSAFEIHDSLKKSVFGIESANISTKGSNYIELVTKNPLDTMNKWFVEVHGFIKDSSGNEVADSNNKTYFYSINEQDTIIPRIIKLPFKDSTTSVNPDQSFDLIFNTGMTQSDSIDIKLHQPEGSKDLAFDKFWKDGNYFSIKPKQILLSDSWYLLSVDLKNFKASNGFGLKDSTLRLRFKTKDIRNNGGISGILKGNIQSGGKYIVNLISKDKSQIFTSKADISGKWVFENIPPGLYSFEVFLDKDDNGRYSFGEPFPYKPAEQFYVFDKELEIKPRWKVEDLIITIP